MLMHVQSSNSLSWLGWGHVGGGGGGEEGGGGCLTAQGANSHPDVIPPFFISFGSSALTGSVRGWGADSAEPGG